jgi:hypothetical protein
VEDIAMTWLLVPLALALVGLAGSAASAADFYVSARGRDTWSGRLAAPNAGRTDGPFATIPRAQQAVRALKAQQPGRAAPIVVSIGGGTYFLEAPLVFTPEDSGTTRAPVIYRAANVRRPPVFSGGVRLRGFTETPAGAWQVTLPEVARGGWRFVQLFVNGQRRSRPRLPKGGYYFIAEALPSTPGDEGKGYDRFRYSAGDIEANWHNPGDVEVLVFHNWTMDRLRIASVDEAQRAVTFTGATVAPMEFFDLAKGRRYIVENVREAQTEPGEWYLDSGSGLLTYLPMAGEVISKATVIAPRLDRLVQFAGNAAANRWVEHITLEDLVFTHTNWVTPPEGYASPQAESRLPGAITATGALHCALKGCVVRQVGTYAVEWGTGCKDNQVVDCDLTDLGAGGVKIGDMNLYDDPNLVASGNAVRNCSITHGGRLHPAGIGVWVGQSHHNTIEHNEIWDLYYSGLSVGWTWGYGPSQCHHNTIAYNDVHLLGQQVLSDLGGIYTLGISPGTTVHHNHFYDIDYFYYGGWGIYFDEGSTGILAENNLIHDTHGGCFHQHYGESNTFRNNILAFDRSQQIARTRPEDHLSFTFDHNIVYYREGNLLGGNWTWTGGNYAFDSNCYWDAGGRPITFDGLTLEEWRSQRGQDRHSVIADPLFVDPEHRDFTLRPGSPALGLGFVPFDLSATGRTTRPRDPLTMSVLPRAFPAAP